jgi:hypothetical protein
MTWAFAGMNAAVPMVNINTKDNGLTANWSPHEPLPVDSLAVLPSEAVISDTTVSLPVRLLKMTLKRLRFMGDWFCGFMAFNEMFQMILRRDFSMCSTLTL